MSKMDKKKYYEVTAVCDLVKCVRILASSKEEAKKLFMQGDWHEDDLLNEEQYDEEVTRIDEEVSYG